MADWKDAFAAKTEDTTPDIDSDFVWTHDVSADLIKKVKPRNFLTLYALLASPTFTGTPAAPTAGAGTNTTQLASTAFVTAAVLAAINGNSWKQAVRVATTANGTLATAFANAQTVDGVTLATGDRILLKNQTSATENGIYIVAASGAPARATDADSGAELVNASVYVSEGTANADKQYVCTTNATITIGATSITFAEFTSGTASISDTVYGAGWNGDTTNAPSKNAVYDQMELRQPLDSDLTTIAGLTATTDNFLQAKSSAWASRTVAQVQADLQGTGLGTTEVGFRNIPQNSQSAAYTTVAADAGKHILHPAADTTARNFTIDSNANVAYPIGTAITIINQHGGGVITIKITTDTMRLAGAGTTGDRTLAADGVATAIKITSTEWIISGTGLT